MFIRKYWLPLSVFIVAICAVGFYLLATQPPKDPIVIYKAVEPEKPTIQAPIGDTSQGGHWHGDQWHAEPHAPVEVSEAEVSADRQDAPDVLAAPVVAEQANTQIDAATLESAERRLKDPDIYKAWREWSKEARELSEKYSQASNEVIAVGPQTSEDVERYKNDPEWQRRCDEGFAKMGEIYGMMIAHEKENPLLQ